MKKFLIAAFSAACCLAIASCGKKGNTETSTSSAETTTAETTTATPTTTEEAAEVLGVRIHYKRDDNDYSVLKAAWVWPKSGDGQEFSLDQKDDYGIYCTVPMDFIGSAQEIGIIVKSAGSWTTKDYPDDIYAALGQLILAKDNYYDVYLMSGDGNIYTTPEGTMSDGIKSFTVSLVDGNYVLKFSLTTAMSSFTITKNGEALVSSETAVDDVNVISQTDKEFSYNLGTEMPNLGDSYEVSVSFPDDQTLTGKAGMSALYKTEAFTSQYTYDGDLGAIYTKESTTFRVWSPISTDMKLRVYETGTPLSIDSENGSNEYEEYQMTAGPNGTWEYTLSGDQEGKYYTYAVTNYLYDGVEVVDPYAKSTGINGLRGMVVDFSKTNPDGWDDVSIQEIPSTSLTVYETHIADLTSSSTWGGTAENAKLFNGFYESGTTYTEDGVTVTTGFDHIKELGVNAVQIIPVFDAQNDERDGKKTFNWGYNPLNYNSLDGIYSSDPYDGYTKIEEFKKLVMAYNEAGINIIMDVVYNHVNGASESNFDVLMPYYYFRYNGTALSNGSGCGNETASEMPMFRKFMIDSTEFWASEYKLGGFRFDLMGLHDLETMNEIAANLHTNVSEYVTVYGEPWTGGTSALTETSAAQASIASYDGFGCFNDQMRDGLIKGGMNSAKTKGWVTASPSYSVRKLSSLDAYNKLLAKGGMYYMDENSNYVLCTDESQYVEGNTYYIKSDTNVSDCIGSIKNGISGSVLGRNDPYKTVNYVTCHDNYTLYDRIKAAGITDEATIKKMAMLANSVVFTSQGISFMLAGEEFLRTKGGNSNSYNASYKVNELDYSLKIKNADMFVNYQQLIALKQKASVFGLDIDGCDAVKESFKISSDNAMMYYDINDTVNNITYRIVHCDGIGNESTHYVDLDGYTLYLDTMNTGVELTSNTFITAYQTIIAYKSIAE